MKFRYFVSEEEAKLLASEVAELKEGRGDEDLLCNR